MLVLQVGTPHVPLSAVGLVSSEDALEAIADIVVAIGT
jgi:hypothetical protein